MVGMKTFKSIIICFAVAATFQACTVGYSFTGADIPAQAKTISVKTFQMATPLAPANYSLRISESLKDLMLSQTSLDLVDKRGDLQYEGVVTKYDIGSAAISSDEVTSLNRLTISVKVKYVNSFDRDKNMEKTFSRFADFNTSDNFSSKEDVLIKEINDQLTQDIFDATLGAW